MPTGTKFTTDIGTIIQEDYSLNPIFTTTNIYNVLKSSLRLVGGRTLSRDVRTNITVITSGATAALPTGFIEGYHVVLDSTNKLDIEDYKLLELLSGVSAPFVSSGTAQVVVEVYDSGSRCYRLIPKDLTGSVRSAWTSIPTDEWVSDPDDEWGSEGRLEVWYKSDFEYPDTIGYDIHVSQWFLTAVKFHTLHTVYNIDTDIQDVEKAAIFKGLSDITISALRTLFVGKEEL